MNAAARAINQSNFFNGQLLKMRLSKPLCFILALMLGILSTAFAIIYTTNNYRMSFIEFEQLAQQTNQLQLQWGQLLLEQASLATPARVEQLASQKLDMKLPTDSAIFILRSQ
jgi:cell division protein FtsL